MPAWRFGLIGTYLAFSLVGVWFISFGPSPVGMVLVIIGFVCISLHLLLERKERKEEERAQAAWVAEIKAIADNVNLETYGIPNLEELSRYHDAKGRAEVLAALQALPPGQRSLLTAAVTVEADAVWD